MVTNKWFGGIGLHEEKALGLVVIAGIVSILGACGDEKETENVTAVSSTSEKTAESVFETRPQEESDESTKKVAKNVEELKMIDNPEENAEWDYILDSGYYKEIFQAIKEYVESEELENFTREDIMYGLGRDYKEDELYYVMDNIIDVDWKQKAIKKAQNYLKEDPHSYKGIKLELETDGFWPDEYKYAANNLKIDWQEQANKYAEIQVKEHNKNEHYRDMMIEDLQYNLKFEEQQAIIAVDKALAGLK